MSTQLQLEGLGDGRWANKDGAPEAEINIKAARGGNGRRPQ